MASITLEHVTKRFDQTTIVNDLSLTIADEEFLVLVGPSGCGKSTILRLITGLEALTEGQVLMDGQPITHKPPKDRDLAMVFQNYALYPHMSVQDNMGFALKMRGVPKATIREKVTEVAKTLGLETLLERKPKQLSGGQRQRVALGRAIVRNPKAFLMDEPLSNLDAKMRLHMRQEITALRHRLKATVLYVTHDQVEAMTMGDRIAVMHRGVLQQVDTPQTVYHHPANAFVAEFMGQINWAYATVTEANAANGVTLSLAGLPEHMPPVHWGLPASHPAASAIAARGLSAVLVGFRPESPVMQTEATAPGTLPLGFTIDRVEHLGSEWWVHSAPVRQGLTPLLTGVPTPEGGLTFEEPRPWLVKCPGHQTVVPSPGVLAQWQLSPSRVMVFDPLTQVALG